MKVCEYLAEAGSQQHASSLREKRVPEDEGLDKVQPLNYD
jgi:hypothetical protein